MRCVLLLFLLSVLSAVVGVFHDLDLQMMLQRQKRAKQRLEISHISNWQHKNSSEKIVDMG
jgi:hypothetical protein